MISVAPPPAAAFASDLRRRSISEPVLGSSATSNSHILFSTGNIVKVPKTSTAEEIIAAIGNHNVRRDDSVSETLSGSVRRIGAVKPLSADELEGRANLNVCAKIFFTHHSNPDSIVPAIDTVTEALGTSHLDTITAHWTPSFAFPSRPSSPTDEATTSSADDQDFLAGVLPFWETLAATAASRASTLAVSGFSQSGLDVFLPSTTVKPQEVNISARDSPSTNLLRLSQQMGFEVCVEGDSAEELGRLVDAREVKELAGGDVGVEWICKYTVFDKSRGVLLSKG